MTTEPIISPRQRLFRVRFGGELLWMGDSEKAFDKGPDLKNVLEALVEEADGVRRATVEILDEQGGSNVYFTLLVFAPDFCASWADEVDEIRRQGEVIEPAAIVEGDLREGTLDALTFIVDEHLPEDWEFSAFSDLAVTLPQKRKAA